MMGCYETSMCFGKYLWDFKFSDHEVEYFSCHLVAKSVTNVLIAHKLLQLGVCQSIFIFTSTNVWQSVS